MSVGFVAVAVADDLRDLNRRWPVVEFTMKNAKNGQDVGFAVSGEFCDEVLRREPVDDDVDPGL